MRRRDTAPSAPMLDLFAHAASRSRFTGWPKQADDGSARSSRGYSNSVSLNANPIHVSSR
eukprot:637463-Pleurochrysis_carterae.AAC.1